MMGCLKSFVVAFSLLTAISFTACGGGSSGANHLSPPPPNYTIGGTILGLSGTGLVLQNNGNSLSVSADGNFTFPTAITSGSTYNVSVATQPSGQTCTVSNGSGTATSNVSNITVTCSTNTTTT
jgi:hypothetical protein